MSLDFALKLHRLPRRRIVVLGDRLLDVDLHGRCERYDAAVAGCPVFAVERVEQRPGGAAAVAAMVEALGCEAILVSGERHSTKTRHLADGVERWRHDVEAGPPSHDEESEIARRVTDAVCEADVVLVADYGKGVCGDRALDVAIGGALGRDIPCIVDPHNARDWSRYRGATAIKCNRREWQASVCPLPSIRCLMTDGARGITDRGHGTEHPARPRSVVDVTGAGDMVLAALGVCAAGGLSWADGCRVANAAAGCKVERRGAVPVSRNAVVADLLHGEKVLPPELAGVVADAARERGRRVVCTGGCFDVLHAGHLQLLREAKRLGDTLIVLLNDDAAVRRLKGSTRPVVPQHERAALLAGLGCVDAVVLFGEDTPATALDCLRPNVYVKGGDYAARPLPERETVERHGGGIVFVPHTGHSTTALLACPFGATPPQRLDSPACSPPP